MKYIFSISPKSIAFSKPPVKIFAFSLTIITAPYNRPFRIFVIKKIHYEFRVNLVLATYSDFSLSRKLGLCFDFSNIFPHISELARWHTLADVVIAVHRNTVSGFENSFFCNTVQRNLKG